MKKKRERKVIKVFKGKNKKPGVRGKEKKGSNADWGSFCV